MSCLQNARLQQLQSFHRVVEARSWQSSSMRRLHLAVLCTTFSIAHLASCIGSSKQCSPTLFFGHAIKYYKDLLMPSFLTRTLSDSNMLERKRNKHTHCFKYIFISKDLCFIYFFYYPGAICSFWGMQHLSLVFHVKSKWEIDRTSNSTFQMGKLLHDSLCLATSQRPPLNSAHWGHSSPR